MAKRKKGTQTIGEHTYYKKYFNGHTYYGKTPEELAEKLKKAQLTLGTSIEKNPTITIEEYAKKWLTKVKDTVSDSTYSFYSHGVKIVTDRIGRELLVNSTPALLENCVTGFAHTECKQTGDYPSQDYIRAATTVLKQIYKQAKKEMIFQFNYADDIKVKSLKQSKKKKHRSLTQTEINRVLNFPHLMRPYVLFLLLCGLMPEETVPLTWGDIKFDKTLNTYFVNISKTAELNDTGTVIRYDITKTEYRKRTIPIPYPLDEWIKKESRYHNNTELIFKNRDGMVLTKSGLKRRWSSYLTDMDIYYNHKKNKYDHTRTEKDKELSIDKFNQYDLRHTYGTLLADFAPVRKVTALMGHSESSTADKYYIDFSKLDTSAEAKQLSDKIKEISQNSNKN